MSEELVKGTKVPYKKLGDKLYHEEINSINSVVNSFVPVINNSLKGFCNVNISECSGEATKMTLQEALEKIAIGRRCVGMRIKFLCSDTNDWEVYDYQGVSTSDSDWLDISKWLVSDQTLQEIDGGEF